MKVSVDRSRCYGSAECAHRAPAVFAFEDGYGVVRPGWTESAGDPRVREAIRESVEKCPSQAVTFTEGEG
ncbi:ferredoxin [Streptomyces naphthomycinicus]|uniref:ferredoxin n=1 Tax=Streptomyces naphthomycinicus TaxID=2872625 RepID=UPI001CEC4CFB|nr:ferredoxin [Streptomyces sp. TML10]